MCGRGVRQRCTGMYKGVRQGCTWVCGRGVQGYAAEVYMGVRQVCIWVWQGLQGCGASVKVCAGVVGVYRGVRQGCTGVYRTGVCSVQVCCLCIRREHSGQVPAHRSVIMLMSGSSRRIFKFYQQKLQVGFLPGEKQELSIIICPLSTQEL